MKKILYFFILIVVLLGGFFYWFNNINYTFRVVSEGKVYKSALIPPEKLEDFLIPYKIKTVIDLLDPGVQDSLNPATIKEINAEDKAIKSINKKYNLHVLHINIPSPQVPTKQTLTKFFKIIDDPKNYPILIHCYHGMGRAEIYSSIYLIEKEGWDNEKARMRTRILSILVDSFLHHSSFARGREKGDFLINYKPRSFGQEATINRL